MIWAIIGSGNGLSSPVRRQTITWTNAGLLLIGPLVTTFSVIWIGICSLSFKQNAFENVVCQNGGYFVQGNELSFSYDHEVIDRIVQLDGMLLIFGVDVCNVLSSANNITPYISFASALQLRYSSKK